MPALLSISEVIEFPEGVDAEIEGKVVRIRGPRGELERELSYPKVIIRKEGRNILIESRYPRSREKAIIGTLASHIRNMMKGLTQGFEYKLKAVHAHFPMTIKVSEDKVIIDNFVGEKVPREVQIVGGCKVSVKGDIVTVEGSDIEEVGRTAGNIEQATVVRGRDRRVFQDGIYLIEKNGVLI